MRTLDLEDDKIIQMAIERCWNFSWTNECVIDFVREHEWDRRLGDIDEALDEFENLPGY